MYSHFKTLMFFISIMVTAYCFSQQLPLPRNIQHSYQKGTRSSDGKPGKNYWQNTARYKLQVNFSPDTRLVIGKVEINYKNNSPDTLNEIWFKLYPNLYKKGAPRQTDISPDDVNEGITIESF